MSSYRRVRYFVLAVCVVAALALGISTFTASGAPSTTKYGTRLQDRLSSSVVVRY